MPIRIGQNQLANESSEVPGRTVWRVWMDSRPQRLRGSSRALHQVRMGSHFDSKPILDNQYVTTIRPPESGLVGKSVGKLLDYGCFSLQTTYHLLSPKGVELGMNHAPTLDYGHQP